MPKPKKGNIYDLIEWAAPRRQIPRLELWEEVLKGIIEKELRPLNLNLSEWPNPVAAPAVKYGGWFSDILRAVVDRRFDPTSVAHIFRKIIVRRSDFESFLRGGNIGGRGPKPDATGFQAVDRKLFPKIKRLKNSGDARSVYGAALKLAKEIAGSGSPESKAKRVSALYRKEHPESR